MSQSNPRRRRTDLLIEDLEGQSGPQKVETPVEREAPAEDGVSKGWRLAGTGTRIAGGITSGIVGFVPTPLTTAAAAAIAGGSEALAQKLETPSGTPINKSRVALEAGIGAVPGGKLFKTGQLMRNMLRGAAFAETGTLARRYDETGKITPPSVSAALLEDVPATGIGALGGAIPAVLGRKGKVPGADRAKERELEQAFEEAVESAVTTPTKPGNITKPGGLVVKPGQKATSKPPTRIVNKPEANAVSIEEATPMAPKVAEAYSEVERTKAPIHIVDKVDQVDHSIEQAKKLAEAQRKLNETTRRTETALQRREQNADLQDIRARQGGTDISKPQQAAAKAQEVAAKDVAAVEKAQETANAIRAKEAVATAKAQDEARQLKEVERLKGTLTEERDPSSISETVSAPGEHGGKARATFTRTAPEPDDAEEAGRAIVPMGGPIPESPAPTSRPAGPINPHTTYRTKQEAQDALIASKRSGHVETVSKGRHIIRFDPPKPQEQAATALLKMIPNVVYRNADDAAAAAEMIGGKVTANADGTWSVVDKFGPPKGPDTPPPAPVPVKPKTPPKAPKGGATAETPVSPALKPDLTPGTPKPAPKGRTVKPPTAAVKPQEAPVTPGKPAVDETTPPASSKVAPETPAQEMQPTASKGAAPIIKPVKTPEERAAALTAKAESETARLQAAKERLQTGKASEAEIRAAAAGKLAQAVPENTPVATTKKADAPTAAAAKVTNEVTEVIDTKGLKSAAEVQNKVIDALKRAHASLMQRGGKNTSVQQHKAYGGREGTIFRGDEPVATYDRYGNLKWIDEGSYTTVNGKRVETPSQFGPKLGHVANGGDLKPRELALAAEAKVADALGEGNIKIEIPGDGSITVKNNTFAIEQVIRRIEKAGKAPWHGIVDKGKTPKIEPPIEHPWGRPVRFGKPAPKAEPPKADVAPTPKAEPPVKSEAVKRMENLEFLRTKREEIRAAIARGAKGKALPRRLEEINGEIQAYEREIALEARETAARPPKLIKKSETAQARKAPEPTASSAPVAPAKTVEQLSKEMDDAWQKYFSLKESSASAEDIRAAGKAGGELQAELKKAAEALRAEGKEIPLNIKAKFWPDEMNSDEIIKLDPSEQSRLLTRLTKKLKDHKGEITSDTLVQLGLGGVGAMAGAAMTPNDPLLGALVGGSAGFFGPAAIRAGIEHVKTSPYRTPEIRKQSTQFLAQKAWENVQLLGRMVPEYYRASLLLHPINLPINMWVGPYGAAVMAAITDAVTLDPRGFRALKLLMNPKEFPMKYWGNWDEAVRAIDLSVERTEGQLGQAGPKWFRQMTAFPGELLTAGDITARDILMRAGYTLEEAKRITLTSEPYTPFGSAVSHFRKAKGETGKASWFAHTLIPFYRTNVNQIEQGLERFPLLGFFMHSLRKQPDTFRQQLAQQLVGGGVMTTMYYLGTYLPPDEYKYTLKLINNFGGQYGTLASIAFIAGQAERKKRSKGWGNWASKTARTSVNAFKQRDMPNISGGLPFDVLEWAADDKIQLPYGIIPPVIDPRVKQSLPDALNIKF